MISCVLLNRAPEKQRMPSEDSEDNRMGIESNTKNCWRRFFYTFLHTHRMLTWRRNSVNETEQFGTFFKTTDVTFDLLCLVFIALGVCVCVCMHFFDRSNFKVSKCQGGWFFDIVFAWRKQFLKIQTMDTNSIERCRLCFESSDDFVNVFENFQDSTIATVLTQHFWFQVWYRIFAIVFLCFVIYNRRML